MMPLDENPKYVDNGIRCNPINQWKVDTWQVREPNLDSSFLPNGLGGKITERKGKREKGRDWLQLLSKFPGDRTVESQ